MKIFEKKGKFEYGVNFWASEEGIRMWRNWNEESVRRDIEALKEAGISILRVFPDWSYFQPIDEIKGWQGGHRGYTADDGTTLLHDNNENSGLNEEAFERFAAFLKICEENEMRVIPSILTGWMSGRLFIPHVIKGDLITDSSAIKQEVRFIRAFVKRFKDSKVISAWCLGNECNCLGKAVKADDAWLWTAMVSDAIRALDDRPIISGMHSLKTPGEAVWTIEDQAENTDILTTHPYGSPTYSSDIDPINTFRPLLHPAAQTLLYRGIGGKPCIIEETGTFGELYADEESTKDYIRCCLYSSWAYDCRGYFWWIAFDQGHLTYYPFYTNNRASNYGVLKADRSHKDRLSEFTAFGEFMKKFNQDLPERIVDGVCIIAKGQASWPVAYNSFLLSRQAGLDIEYKFANEEFPDSNLYIIPSLADAESIRADALAKIMDRVAQGAVLYISTGNGLIRNLGKDFGVKIHTRSRINGTKTVDFGDGDKFNVGAIAEYKLIPNGGKVLATDENGDPIYVSADYGKGKVFWLPAQLESWLFDKSGAFHKENAAPYYRVYREFAKFVPSEKCAAINSLKIGMTEHILDQNKRLLVCINYSPEAQTAEINLSKGFSKLTVYHGKGTVNGNTVKIEPNQPLILEVSK